MTGVRTAEGCAPVTGDRLYKVLRPDGSTYHGGRGAWPLPNGKPGAWVKVTGEIVPCSNGLHVCKPEHLFEWLGPAIFTVETHGEIVDAGDKLVVREARLTGTTCWDDRVARLFAADCAERALRRERRAGREPDARSWEAIKVARRFANGKASSEELAAAWAAAWAAARDAAWAAARYAAWDAAWAAARDAAWPAARAAERRWQTKRLIEYLDGKRGAVKA